MKFSLPINKNIAGTLRAWRSEFVGGRIVSISDLIVKDFDPSVNFGTMTATDQIINRAKYFVIGPFMWFSFDIEATLAATFAAEIVVSLPLSAAGSSSIYQGFSGVGRNGGTGEPCMAQILGGQNKLSVYRDTTANYSAGSWRARINGILEID